MAAGVGEASDVGSASLVEVGVGVAGMGVGKASPVWTISICHEPLLATSTS